MAGKKTICLCKVDISVDFKDSNPGVLKLLGILRPEWEESDITLKELHGGCINKIVLANVASDEKKCGGIVVRIFASELSSFDANVRHKEIAGMTVAHAAGCCPKVYAVFNNGVAYGFSPGENLSSKDLSNPDIIRPLTKLLAQLHYVDVDALEITDDAGGQYTIPKVNPLIRMLEAMLAQWPPKFEDPEKQKKFDGVVRHNKEEMLKETQIIMQRFMGKGATRGCLCHGDVHQKNIVYDKTTGSLQLIDFEMINFSVPSVEFKQVFTPVDVFKVIGLCSEDDEDHTDETRRLWVKSYLQACAELEGKHASSVKEEDVDKMFDETVQAITGMNLVGAVFMLLNPEPDLIRFDAFTVAIKLYEEYLKSRAMAAQ